jgi:hypothetical protein
MQLPWHRRRGFIAVVAGAMAAWPLAPRAQQRQKAMPVIGVLYAGSASADTGPFMRAFRQGCGKPATSRDRTSRWNSARRTAITIGCLHWPPSSSPARSI